MSSKAGIIALALAVAAALASSGLDAQGRGGGGGGARTPPSGGPGTGNPGRPGGPVYGGGGWHGGGWQGGGGWHGGSGWHGSGGWRGGYYRHWAPSVGIYYGWPYAWGWGPGWYWGAPWYGWGWGWGYTFPWPGSVGFVEGPVEYVERAPAADGGLWFYCEDPPGYFPHVSRCNRAWIEVRPSDVQGTAPAPRQ